MNLPPDLIAYIKSKGLPIAVVDIDGVTLDNNHRLPHICHTVDGKQVQRDDPDWEAFHAVAHLDADGAAVPLIKRMAGLYFIVFLTARVAFANKAAEVHARLTDIMERRGFALIMRDPVKTVEGDSVQSHAEFKRQQIHQLREHGLSVEVGIDDSLAICQMFKEEGLLSLRVHNHVQEEALWR